MRSAEAPALFEVFMTAFVTMPMRLKTLIPA